MTPFYFTGDPDRDRKRAEQEVAFLIITERPVPKQFENLVVDACVRLARCGLLVPIPEKG